MACVIDGQRLAELREDKKLTQAELGDQLGVSRNSIASYEQGRSNPGLDVYLDICKYFNVSSDYLIGLTDLEISYRRENHIALPDLPPASIEHIKTRIGELIELERYRNKDK